MSEMPKFYQKLQKDYGEVMEAVDRLGKAVQNAGPPGREGDAID